MISICLASATQPKPACVASSPVLAIDASDDGVRFDFDTHVVGPIRDDQDYGGVRVEVVARITTARVRLQIDVGFGDAITPEAIVVDYPAPRLRAYPRETVIVEKLEATTKLGRANSRMKDFYDLAIIARDYDFEAALLLRAIRATFDRRHTPLPRALPVALTAVFAEDPLKQTQWSGFVRKAGIRDASSLVETVAAVAAFVEMPLMAATDLTPRNGRWRRRTVALNRCGMRPGRMRVAVAGSANATHKVLGA